MTRFARAKGSKSSNERQPNEPTPWHVMKVGLNEDHNTRICEKPKSASELLKAKDELVYYDTIGNVNHGWSEFDNTQVRKKNDENDKVQNNKSESTKKKLKKAHKSDKNDHVNDSSVNQLKNKNNVKDISNVNHETNKEITQHAMSTNSHVEIKNEKTLSKNMQAEHVKNGEITAPLSKRQKRNRKMARKNSTNETIASDEKTTAGNTKFNIEGNNWSTDVKFGKKHKLGEETNKNNYLKKQDNSKENETKKKTILDSNPYKNTQQGNKRKAPKVRDDNTHKRRKPDIGRTTITVNGKDIDIVKYDGFPIMKEDAERLKNLKEEMVNKGIPYSEINRALKLERRRCEKVLARRKKNVCFHCRTSGHNLSECPDLDKQESAIGICFKCGSTEHTHYECRVNKTQEFRYATCFICREEGHIAKQCPDNPKGLYPDGGACKICGDVTHLRKDCPDLVKEKEENTITVDTITSEDIESLDKNASNTAKASKTKNNTAKTKIINF
ncbi:zinc finger CCHC domain-containing protein 9 [Cephus cinctus]|uniref:Zinc finger CCHC domain-containing protein 9 n=1 Tax=Cephus cinctus TaxID=211228 RepID=A0AAJ7RBH7_CEPCN|nr:zinc finger CCHC domain-containing protein 9 [Cephus cinctus]XP_015588257.1 zinc finger CCHC domain-containing protein 9 [Cephus cinctus]XP_024937502.1 zinc finger CCHC domain-containing protein 9 [Cephus cinctus]